MIKRFKNINRHNRTILLEFIILYYFFINLISEANLRKLNLDSEITIVIKGNGTQQILTDSTLTFHEYKEYDLPNQILVNGILQNYTGKYVYNLTHEMNKITMRWNNQITSCNSMFFELSNIISVDLSKFDSSKVESFDCFFFGCKNIKSINLTNLNTSSCLNMAGMFDLCSGLETLNLSSFDTSKVTSMRCMFLGCTSLKLLDLSNFDTPKVEEVQALFLSCSSLIFINLKKFDTSNVLDSSDMFLGVNNNLIYCADSSKISSIQTLLSNYNNNCSDICFTNQKSKAIFNKKKCIDNCYNDNDYKFEYNNECYESCPKGTHISNLNNKLCEDDLNCFNYYNYNNTDCLETIPEGYYLIDSLLGTIGKCDDKCQSCNLESVQNDLCLSCNINNSYYPLFNNDSINSTFINCYNDSIIGYILDNKVYKPCYDICKNCIENKEKNNEECINCKLKCYNDCNYYYFFDENNEYCCTETNKCPSKYNKLITEKKKCVNNCTNDDIYIYELNGICYNSTELLNGLYIVNNGNNNPEEKDIIISNIRELIKGGIDSIMLNISDGENKGIIIKDSDIVYQIIPTTVQNNSIKDNISTIYLGECEKKLKKQNNISENESLLIFKMDIYKEGSSIPIVEYEVYDSKTKNQLNLSICNDTKIEILIPVIIEENNINKYNSSDDYYNDICYTYTTESGTDIILTDRKNEFINNNMTICETKCEYEGYELDFKKAKCECEVKIKIPLMSEITINKNILMNKLDIKNSLNIKILKCYKLLLSKNGLIGNIGSYIILSIIFIISICLIIFLNKDYYKIIAIIYRIISFNKNKTIISKINSFKEKKIIKKKKWNKKKKKNKKQKSKKKKKKIINANNINLIIMNNKIENSNKIINDSNMGHSPPKNRAKTNRKINYYINNLQTNGEDLNGNSSYKLKKNDKKKDKIEALNISKIDTGNDNIKMLLKFNDYEINSLTYEEAKKFDKRGYIDYYFSLLRIKQTLIFSFYTSNDYNSKMVKICLFLFSFALYFTVNALFYSDSTMHKIYEDNGKFNFIYQIPLIIYSTLISSVINIIVSTLSLTEKNIISLKKGNNLKNQELIVIKSIRIKYVFFFILSYLFLGLFWYYISCFCAVYRNTQIHLIKDSVISFVLCLIYPFFLCLIPGIFRIPALKPGKNDMKCLYKFSKIAQLI